MLHLSFLVFNYQNIKFLVVKSLECFGVRCSGRYTKLDYDYTLKKQYHDQPIKMISAELLRLDPIASFYHKYG